MRNTSTTPGTYNFGYVFNYTDHLGNVRLSYFKNPKTNALEVLEEDNYYPFGLKHQGYNADNLQPDYKYKYNGKEFQDELGLNMTAMDYRQYDNALGRFNSIDVLAELFPEESPFNFSLNNPIFFSDPTGLCPECEKNVKDPKAGQSYTSSGGATYTYNDGKWTQQGGELAEVTITATPKKKSTEGQAGNAEGNTRLFGLIQNANVNSSGESPLEEYRRNRDNPGYLPGEDRVDRIFRLINSSHMEQMQDFGSGGHNMFGGYGRATRAGQGYSSFNAFKRANGAAGEGMAWHHIVEQHSSNILKFGAEKIQNTNNLIKIEHGAGSLHAKVTGHYNSLMPGTTMRVRDYVKTLGYGEQYQYGIETLKRFGWKP